MTTKLLLLTAVPFMALCQVRGTTVSSTDFSGTASTSVAMPAWNVLGGGTIVGCVRYSTAPGVTITVSDTASNTFVATGYAEVNGANQIAMFKAEHVTASTSDIITLHFSSAANYTAEAAVQYSGTAASAYDTGSSASSNVSGTFTTAQGPEVVVACGTESYNGGTMSPGTIGTSPATAMGTAATSQDLLVADGNLYQVANGVTTSYNYTDSTGTYGIVVGTFKSSSATSPPVLTQAIGNYSASTYPQQPYTYSGGTATVSFTVTNPNSSMSLNGIAFSDTLPANLVVATPNGLTGSCPGGTIGATAGSSAISLSGAALAGAATCSFSVNVLSTAAGATTNATGPISATQSGGGGAATATIQVYGTPTVSISSIAVNAVEHSSVQLTYSLSGPGYCQLQYGVSSGNYIYATGSAPSYANTPGGLVQGCQLAIGGLAPNTTYYVMPTARPDANDTAGICYSGGGCGTSEVSFTTLAAPGTHPAPPVPPTVWTPTEPNTSSYTVVSMQADPVTGYCEAATGVAKQANWSSAVSAGDSFQKVINEIWFDTVIEFSEGSSCIVPSAGPDLSGVALPAYSPNGGSSDWVVIRTHSGSASDFPPFGVRTGPQFASKLATLVAEKPNTPSGQNLQGEIFNCYSTNCNHFWIENVGMTHQFNSTIYPAGVVDPPAYGPYVAVTSANAATGFQTGLNLSGTSTNSLTIGQGTQAFTTQAGLGYAAGSVIQMTNPATGYIMQGSVTSYNSSTGSLVANIGYTTGAGTFSSWTLLPPPDHIVLDRVYVYPQPWPSREINCFTMAGNYWAVVNSYCATNMWVEGVYPHSNPVNSISNGAAIEVPNTYFQFNAFDNTPIGMTTAAGYAGTSTTSLSFATGTQSFQTSTGLSYSTGNMVELYNSGACLGYPGYMIGTVTSYNSATGSMVANITGLVGSGTCASWSLVTPATVTFSGPSLSTYSGAVYAWIGSTGLTVEYQTAAGVTVNCNGCTAQAVSAPARSDVPATGMYYFNGYFSGGTFVLASSTPWGETPSQLESFRPMGLYFYPGQYGLFDNNYLQAIGQTIYNDTYGLVQDMSWTHNYLYFPRSKMQNSGQWDGYGYSFRNVVESKQQVRGQYIGNIFDGSAAYENAGQVLLFVGAYQSIYWSFGSSDIRVTGNIMKHISSGIEGAPAAAPEAPTLTRVAITNNFLLDLNRDLYNFGGGSLVSGPFFTTPMTQDLNISNNTVGLTKGSGPSLFLFGATDPGTSVMGEGLQFTNNVLMTSLGGLDVFFSESGGQQPSYPNFPVNPVVPISGSATATTWQKYFNSNWIEAGATGINPSYTLGNNVVIGAQCNQRGGSQCNSSGSGANSWVDLTQTQIANYIQNLWNPNLDSTSVFPNPAAGTMASRLAAIGWNPSMNLAGGNPNPYGVVPTVYNAGNIGASATTVNQLAGIVNNISVIPGSTALQFNYTAPDARACSVDITSNTDWTRLTDAGGGFSRTLTFTGLSAATPYQYRIMCYFDQSAAYEFLPSQITSGTVSTTASVSRSVFQEFALPAGATKAVLQFLGVDGSSVNQTCTASPCSVSLAAGNWKRVLTYETAGGAPAGAPSSTNITVQ